MQMMLMNMHHITPIRPVPRWLQITRDIFSCRLCCRRGQVEPTDYPKDPEEEPDGTVLDDVDTKEDTAKADPALLRELRVLSEKVKSDEKENAMAEEWKQVANVFDRLLFSIFIIFQVIMAIVCFGILPM